MSDFINLLYENLRQIDAVALSLYDLASALNRTGMHSLADELLHDFSELNRLTATIRNDYSDELSRQVTETQLGIAKTFNAICNGEHKK